MNEIIFAGGKWCDRDFELLLNEDDEINFIDEEDKTIAHLLAKVKRFPSVKDAKRNGWDKPIPSGWSMFTIGRAAKRTDLYIWNPSTELDEYNTPS